MGEKNPESVPSELVIQFNYVQLIISSWCAYTLTIHDAGWNLPFGTLCPQLYSHCKGSDKEGFFLLPCGLWEMVRGRCASSGGIGAVLARVLFPNAIGDMAISALKENV